MILNDLINEFEHNTAINIFTIDNKRGSVTSCTGVIGTKSVISQDKLNSKVAWIEYENYTLNIGIWKDGE